MKWSFAGVEELRGQFLGIYTLLGGIIHKNGVYDLSLMLWILGDQICA
jgi:hypothetical protein